MLNREKTYPFTQDGFKKAIKPNIILNKKTLNILTLGCATVIGVGALTYYTTIGATSLVTTFGLPIKVGFIKKGAMIAGCDITQIIMKKII